jgi:two-component system, NarL family, sensor histidine kinase BarA
VSTQGFGEQTPEESLFSKAFARIKVEGRIPFVLIFTLAAVLLASLWSAVYHKIEAEREHYTEIARRDTMNLARAFEEHTVSTLRSVDQSVRLLKSRYERLNGQVDIAAYVSDGVIDLSLLNQVGIIDADGIYSQSSLAVHVPVDLSDREHFKVHVERNIDGLFVSKPVLGRATGKWSLQMTRRLNRPDGSFAGVAVISIDPFYFTRFYNEVDLGRQGVVTLVGLDGIVRARRAGDSNEIGQDLSGSPLFRELARARQGSYEVASVIDGVRRISSYRQLKDLPLVVVVGVGEREALQGFFEMRTSYLRFAGFMTVVILMFVLLAAGLLRRQQIIAARLRISQAKAESANRLKSEFLASMSHELRTPLNGVIGYAEYLQETAADDTSKEFAGIVVASGQQLLSQVNAILDLAYIEAGRMQIRRKPVELQELFDELCAAFQPKARAKGLTLVCHAATVGLTSLRCDRVRVLQVLNNLVDNAVKFTAQGQVSLRLALREEEGAQMLAFVVEDSGIGIAEADQELIFERFRQAESFETRHYAGTGLGLALSRELAALMGGRIELQSHPGKGSTFTLLLPVLAENDPGGG